MIGRSQGHLAVTTCVLGLGACTAPTASTDLRPGGAPEVLTVLASDDASGAGVAEKATFCKANDTKRPGLIPAVPDPPGPTQICPEDPQAGADEVTDVVPVGWYIRFQFDELLNPDIEDLLPIIDSKGNNTGTFSGSLANTQPVTITCGGVDVPYDGYYDPSGNSFTWPVGPSLFVTPNDTSVIAAGTECQIALKADVVADKDGVRVPADQLGPYTFKIADLTLASTSPAKVPPPDPDPMKPFVPTAISPTKPLVLTFNATIDVASLTSAEVTIRAGAASCTDTGGTMHTAVIAKDQKAPADATTVDPTAIDIRDGDPSVPAGKAWLPSTTYIVTFTADVKGLAGASFTLPAADKLTICFKTTGP